MRHRRRLALEFEATSSVAASVDLFCFSPQARVSMTWPSDPLLTDQVFFCNFSSLHRNPTHTFINRLHLSSCCIGGMPGVPGTCPCTESTVDPKDAAHAGAASKCARAPSVCRLCHCPHRLMPPVTRPACIGGMPGVPGTCPCTESTELTPALLRRGRCSTCG